MFTVCPSKLHVSSVLCWPYSLVRGGGDGGGGGEGVWPRAYSGRTGCSCSCPAHRAPPPRGGWPHGVQHDCHPAAGALPPPPHTCSTGGAPTWQPFSSTNNLIEGKTTKIVFGWSFSWVLSLDAKRTGRVNIFGGIYVQYIVNFSRLVFHGCCAAYYFIQYTVYTLKINL